MANSFTGMFLLPLFIGMSLSATESDENKLLARGEHRIEVINYGHRDPEIPIWIMQSNYYNAHHPGYVIRIEDLNQTINKEINEDERKEYNEWFNAEYNRRRAEEQYYENQSAEYNQESNANRTE